MKLGRLFRREGKNTLRSRSGATSVRSGRLLEQPSAGLEDAAVALEVHRRPGGGLSFIVLARPRALHPGAWATHFFQKQGEIRFTRARSTCRPAAAASSTATVRSSPSSVPAPSIWVIPRDFEADRDAEARQLAKVLGMSVRRTRVDKPRGSTRTSSGCAARPRSRSRKEVARTQASRACTRCASTSASIRRANRPHTWSASTNADEHGQEGVEFAFESRTLRNATARAVSSRTGSAASSRTSATASPRSMVKRACALTIDSKIQFYRLPARARRSDREHRASSPAAWWCSTRRPASVLAMANYPSFVPGRARRALNGQRSGATCALVDTAEPGSTMKPFIAVAGAGVRPLPRQQTVLNTYARQASTITGLADHRRTPAAGELTVEQIDAEVEQRRHRQDGDGRCRRARSGTCTPSVGFGQKPQIDFPRCASPASCARYKPRGGRSTRRRSSFGYGAVGLADAAGAVLHRVRARRRAWCRLSLVLRARR